MSLDSPPFADSIAAIVVVAVSVLTWHGTATSSQAIEVYALCLGYVFGRGASSRGVA